MKIWWCGVAIQIAFSNRRSSITNTHAHTAASFLEASDLLCWAGSVQQADACWVGQQLDAAAFPFLALLSCAIPQRAGAGAGAGRQQQAAVQVQVLDHLEGVGRMGVETVGELN